MPDKPAVPDVDTTLSDDIIETATEETKEDKKSGSGFLKNLQNNIGELFKSGNYDKAEHPDTKDI